MRNVKIFIRYLAFVRGLNKEKDDKGNACSMRNRNNKSMQNFVENLRDEDSA
jgi:hypothetical protein